MEKYKFDVFLSFSNEDTDFVKSIFKKLIESGLKVFFSGEALKSNIGCQFDDVIEDAIKKSKNFVLVCTPNSMKSEWVKNEYKAFFFEKMGKKRQLILLKSEGFDSSLVPLMMRSLRIAKSVDEIIEILKDQKKEDLLELERKEPEKKIWANKHRDFLRPNKAEIIDWKKKFKDLLKDLLKKWNKKKGQARVTLFLELKIEKFTKAEQESFIIALSRITKISPDKIRILHVKKGSVLVTLEMPEEAAQKLISMYMKGDPTFRSLGIYRVELISKINLPENKLKKRDKDKWHNKSHMQILFLSADPNDSLRLRLNEEAREIQSKLQLSKHRKCFEFHQRMSVRPEDITQALLDICECFNV